MSAREAHPEDLIDRARRGTASEAELGDLAEHLARCPSCRFESALATDAENASLARVSDELLVARLRRSTTRALLARGARPLRARRARALLLVAAALLVGSASLAGVLGYRALAQGAPVPAASPPARATTESRAPRVAGRTDRRETTPGPSSAPAEARPPEPSRAAPPGAPRSASELFTEANRARRAGDVAQAARGYRELTQRYPGSAEALVARVSFGRLLLDRLGNARGALAEFDVYLNNSSHRALREEALIGRAVALGRLGRASEERAAWRTLLRVFPSSTYATRARARLDELESSAAP
jgi:TolA-binding protein